MYKYMYVHCIVLVVLYISVGLSISHTQLD